MDSLVGVVANPRKISDKLFVFGLGLKNFPETLTPFASVNDPSIVWVEVRVPIHRSGALINMTKELISTIANGDKVRVVGKATWGNIVNLQGGETRRVNNIWSEHIMYVEKKAAVVPTIVM
jgi:hypothetical protein